MADQEIRVRRATVTDAAAIASVHARSWRSAYTGLVPDPVIDTVVEAEQRRAVRFGELMADPSGRTSMLVATRGDAVVGMAIWAPSGEDDATRETADVQAIYLDPDAIGQGIGRRLFAAVVGDIRERGFTEATLWVLDTNERARRFYEAVGWRTDGATKLEERAGGVLSEVRYRWAANATEASGGGR
jgi:GNAT superfamily N-acetyltransferase